MNSHLCILSIRDLGTVGKPWLIDIRSLVSVFAWPMFPDTAFGTANQAVAVSEMPATADTTVGEGPPDEHAEAPLEAVAAGGMDAPDAATCSVGTDAGMPPRVAVDVAGACPVEENKKNTARHWPYTRHQLPYN
jgi:hypothetical protein